MRPGLTKGPGLAGAARSRAGDRATPDAKLDQGLADSLPSNDPASARGRLHAGRQAAARPPARHGASAEAWRRDEERQKQTQPRPGVRRFRAGLAPWRLARAEAFVTANLAKPILLADLARAAGLSRMHFAAQFRASTGLQPHAYVLARRIERAQALLRGGQMTLADVALAVGFKSHSHFSTAFRRHLGLSPDRWRRRHALSPGAPDRASAPQAGGDVHRPRGGPPAARTGSSNTGPGSV